MKRYIFYTAFLFVVFGTLCTIIAQDVPESVTKITSKLTKLANSGEIVKAINEQNAKNISLDKIKEIDKKWTSTSGTDDMMKAMLENQASEYLKKCRKDNPYIVEAFAMDNKGANVAMTNKTSDYWQGDEDKFVKSYNNGKGAVHYGKLSFDESVQTYIIQVSVPVSDKGTVIGAVTFGIDTQKLK